MKTREKVLKTALELLNERGVDRVSARTIASEMGISDGNLRYHFRTKEDIVYALYLKLVEQLNHNFAQHQATSVNLSDIYHALRFTFEQFVAYRFILLDFTKIMRQYPNVQGHYRQLCQLREQQFLAAAKDLISNGFFRDDIDQEQYRYLAAHFSILSDAWLARAEGLLEESAPNQLDYFVRVTFGLVMPYLTETGRKEYEHLLVTNSSERSLALRPAIPAALINDTMSDEERFQNETLRPILKMQNPLLLALFRQYIQRRKNEFYQLPEPQRPTYVRQALQKDVTLRSTLKGIVIGHFTEAEWERYTALPRSLDKRIFQLVTQRLLSQLDRLGSVS